MISLQSERLNFYKLSQNSFEDLCQMELDPEVMKHYTSRPNGKREYAMNSFNRYMEYKEKCGLIKIGTTPQHGGSNLFRIEKK
jgi:hypothetical protein